MEHHPRNIGYHSGIKFMLAGGTVVAALGLLFEPQALLSRIAPAKDTCEAVVQPQAVLSRDRLSQLLTLPARASKAEVQQVLKDPYCRLSHSQAQTASATTREAYPLAFDPQTWLVVRYVGDEYIDYSFRFQP